MLFLSCFVVDPIAVFLITKQTKGNGFVSMQSCSCVCGLFVQKGIISFWPQAGFLVNVAHLPLVFEGDADVAVGTFDCF